MTTKLSKSERERFDEYDERWATLGRVEREDYEQLARRIHAQKVCPTCDCPCGPCPFVNATRASWFTR